MESFPNSYCGFIPANPHSYFYFLHNYFNHPLAYYPCNPFPQIQSQNQLLASATLELPFQTKGLPTDSKTPKEDTRRTKRPEKWGKGRKGQSQKEEQQQSFNIKINKSEPSVTYKKKNTESNIVNQTFSFLNSDRSKKLIISILKDPRKVEEYYRIIAKIKQLNKKYINRNYLLRLLAFEPSTEFEKAYIKAKVSLLSIEQVRKVLRVLTFHFLKDQVNTTLITSGKIYKETLPQHFWRKREIMTFLFGPSIH